MITNHWYTSKAVWSFVLMFIVGGVQAISGSLNPNYGNKWTSIQKTNASINNHMNGKFVGKHKITGEIKIVNCGNINYCGITSGMKNKKVVL